MIGLSCLNKVTDVSVGCLAIWAPGRQWSRAWLEDCETESLNPGIANTPERWPWRQSYSFLLYCFTDILCSAYIIVSHLTPLCVSRQQYWASFLLRGIFTMKSISCLVYSSTFSPNLLTIWDSWVMCTECKDSLLWRNDRKKMWNPQSSWVLFITHLWHLFAFYICCYLLKSQKLEEMLGPVMEACTAYYSGGQGRMTAWLDREFRAR